MSRITIDKSIKQFFARVGLIILGCFIPLLWIFSILFKSKLTADYKWEDWIDSWKLSWKRKQLW